MSWKLMAMASCLAVAGCVGGNSMSERQDEDVQSSLRYDDVPCDQLLAQRDGLARQYNLAVDVKPTFSDPALGFGPFTPDIRSKSKRDRDRAIGEIDAMNRSIVRRDCGRPDKQSKAVASPG